MRSTSVSVVRLRPSGGDFALRIRIIPNQSGYKARPKWGTLSRTWQAEKCEMEIRLQGSTQVGILVMELRKTTRRRITITWIKMTNISTRKEPRPHKKDSSGAGGKKQALVCSHNFQQCRTICVISMLCFRYDASDNDFLFFFGRWNRHLINLKCIVSEIVIRVRCLLFLLILEHKFEQICDCNSFFIKRT